MKYVEFWNKAGSKLIEHGVAHKSQLPYILAEGCTLTANLITDEAYAILMDKWMGSNVEPAPTPAPAAPAEAST